MWSKVILFLFTIICACFLRSPGGWDELEVLQKAFKKASISVNTTEHDVQMEVYDLSMVSQIIRDGTLGLGESYIEGKWKVNDLVKFYQNLKANQAELERHIKSSWKLVWYAVKAKILNMNSPFRSKEVIDLHYNLGNELFVAMLGPTMQYTCGYWKNETRTLDTAQWNKMRLLSMKLNLKKGLKVLDIAAGFGTFAEHLAKTYDVDVVGVTLSEAQKAYADQYCAHDRVEIRIQDYRHIPVTEKYDRIVSVGMFEHVGHWNYKLFFEHVNRLLAPNGIFVLHTIGHSTFLHNQGTDPFIEKYIFPGGCIPGLNDVTDNSFPYFILEDMQNIGPSYAKTLNAWRKNFNSAKNIPAQFQTPSFKRMWNIYLSQCEAVFSTRYLQLWQFVFVKKGFTHGQSDYARAPYNLHNSSQEINFSNF